MEPILHLSPGRSGIGLGMSIHLDTRSTAACRSLTARTAPTMTSGATVANLVSMAVAQIPGLRGNRGSC